MFRRSAIVLFALLLGIAGTHSQATATSVSCLFIPAAQRADMIADAARDIVYIASRDGNLLRYDLTSRGFLSPIPLGGRPNGIDISPDGNTLAVADFDASNGSTSSICVVDLSSSAARRVQFSAGKYESGTFSVAFADNQTVLASTSSGYSGYQPARKINVVSGTASVFSQFSAGGACGAMFSASADHTVVGIAQNNTYPIGPTYYRVADGSIVGVQANLSSLYEVAVSRNAQQFAFPHGASTYIYDRNLQQIGAISGTYSDEKALGIAYSPVADIGYIAWANSSGNHNEIVAFDTNSLGVVATIDASPAFTLPGNYYWPFQSGRLRISSDGAQLLALVNAGVNVYAIPEPSALALLGVGAVGLLAYAWRRRMGKA